MFMAVSMLTNTLCQGPSSSVYQLVANNLVQMFHPVLSSALYAYQRFVETHL